MHRPALRSLRLLLLLGVAAAGSFLPIAAAAEPPLQAELLLRGGVVHDGSGGEAAIADVAIGGGRIVAVGQLDAIEAGLVIDCAGLVVCPGFIDLHTHSDRPIVTPETRANVNYLLQGCTTVVTGNCGSGPVDVESYLAKVDRFGAGTHVAHLLPHGSLRDRILGSERRAPTEEELARMQQLAQKAMDDGAFGMSTGLIYVPGTFADTDELVELARTVGQDGGIYASHIRGEGSTLLDSVQEAIEIGRRAELPVHISHFKATGRDAWGSLRLAVEAIEQARKKGQEVTADQYPYAASSTSLEATLLPNWSRAGGRAALLKRLDDQETADRIREAIAQGLSRSLRIQIAAYKPRPSWVGKSLDEIAEQEGVAVVELVVQMVRSGAVSVVNFGMNEDEVRQAMQLSWVATASDGGAKIPTANRPHPRSFGTFPRKIGRYVEELEVLPMAQAIRSATGLPADILGLEDRGYLRVGSVADVAVFDPAQFRDHATYEEPYRPPTGMRYVFVSGVPAVYEGQATGALAGKALRKRGGEAAASAP